LSDSKFLPGILKMAQRGRNEDQGQNAGLFMKDFRMHINEELHAFRQYLSIE
jgi:hypothetical protein